jgi:hypothetical protein
MKQILFQIAIAIIFTSCSGSNTSEPKANSAVVEKQSDKPRPHKSSAAAFKALGLFNEKNGTYMELTNNYKNGFKDGNKVTAEDIANFDDLYNQSCKLRDAIKPVADELDSEDYESFNRYSGIYQIRESKYKHLYLSINKPGYFVLNIVKPPKT